jgi:hypothetical protein
MFAQRQRPNANIDTVRQYLEEVYRLAPLVGIDPAIVVAQSAVESGNWGAIPGAGATAWLERRNPGSIGVTSTGKPGEKDIDAGHSWKDGTDAARGQIVHMLAYSSSMKMTYEQMGQAMQAVEEHKRLDPRFDAVIDAGYLGSVVLLSDLGNGKWAADPKYAEAIARRGNEVFGFREDDTVEYLSFETRTYTAHKGAVVRLFSAVDSPQINQFSRKTPIRVVGAVAFNGERASWYHISSTGKSNRGFIHTSGIDWSDE